MRDRVAIRKNYNRLSQQECQPTPRGTGGRAFRQATSSLRVFSVEMSHPCSIQLSALPEFLTLRDYEHSKRCFYTPGFGAICSIAVVILWTLIGPVQCVPVEQLPEQHLSWDEPSWPTEHCGFPPPTTQYFPFNSSIHVQQF